MVKLARGLVASAAAITTALGAAAPIAADPIYPGTDEPAPEGTVEGIYTYNSEGAKPATWKIIPLCVPDLPVPKWRVPFDDAIACKLQIESDGAAGQSGLYRLSGGQWKYSNSLLAGMTCPDGKSAATQDTYQFDTFLNGTYSRAHNAVCGMQPAIDKQPFTLTFVGPLPTPPGRRPLQCQDNLQHLCS